jgi:hypothetical protein
MEVIVRFRNPIPVSHVSNHSFTDATVATYESHLLPQLPALKEFLAHDDGW